MIPAQAVPAMADPADGGSFAQPLRNTGQIARGADLTDDDISLLAADALEICLWAMRHRMTRDRWHEEVRQGLRARLGRRPLIIGAAP